MGLSYLLDQLEFYVTFKLADDPTLDGDKLIDEFFTRYYGAAAVPMKKLYCAIEDTFSNPRNYPVEIQKSPGHQHQNEGLAWGSLGTEARMAQFAALMDQARAAASTDLEKQRVGLFEKGVWDYMVEGRRKYVARSKVTSIPPPSVKVPRVADAAGDPARVDWSKALLLDKWSTIAGDPIDRKLTGRLAATTGRSSSPTSARSPTASSASRPPARPPPRAGARIWTTGRRARPPPLTPRPPRAGACRWPSRYRPCSPAG
jgi:hypothetical protein